MGCAEYKDELLATVKAMTAPGKGILAMDESNGTCGLRLQSIGVENDEPNRQRWRETLLGTKGLGKYCGGAILFTETLYQKTTDGKLMVDLAKENGFIPGIKVDTGLVPLVGGKEGENWCRGLDDPKERTTDFYEQGARFAKWRTTVRVRDHSALAVSEAAHGLARYANICQSSGLVPIIEPEILLDGEHDIDECLATFAETWSAVFKACQNTTLKTWAGKDENIVAAQSKLFQRASANSKAQLGKYDPATADEDATAAEGMYVKGYTY